MLQLRLMEKKRELVRREDVNALLDQLAGLLLTHRAAWQRGAHL